MAKFTTLTNARFAVRMTTNEAVLYGNRVLDLLDRAQSKLVAKYGIEPVAPTLVEIFSDQKDFGVRTFGMPENPGYLGVCFGRVVTANSPAATKAHPVNWEAVLWHEFCHVITLQMTANKMPRWLSEGISVHEELQENPSWGQHMTARYRSMILKGELTPVGKLSGAFLAPKTPFHLQFAYFEASMVVDFIVERFGAEALRRVLADLRDGVEINETLRQRTLPLPELEKEFAAYAKSRAMKLGPTLDWEPAPNSQEPGAQKVAKVPGSVRELIRGATGGPVEAADVDLSLWAKSRTNNYWAVQQRVRDAIKARDWASARSELERWVTLCPEQPGGDSPWRSLARVAREQGDAARPDVGEQVAAGILGRALAALAVIRRVVARALEVDRRREQHALDLLAALRALLQRRVGHLREDLGLVTFRAAIFVRRHEPHYSAGTESGWHSPRESAKAAGGATMQAACGSPSSPTTTTRTSAGSPSTSTDRPRS
jgi:hypothetical protein